MMTKKNVNEEITKLSRICEKVTMMTAGIMKKMKMIRIKLRKMMITILISN